MRYRLGLCSLILAVPIGCSSIYAQQAGGAPSASSSQATSSAQETTPEAAANAPTPDTRPLSGAEEITTGFQHGARNYVVPSLQVNVYGDTNQVSAATGARDVQMTGSIVGRLSLRHVTRKNHLTLDYMGGGLLYSRNSDFNSMMHQFGISDSFKGRRWGLTLSDRASFLPESPFGFSGFGGIGSGLTTNLPNLNPLYSTNESIISSRGDRINNTVVLELSYMASARSTLTLSGSYGLLRFREPTGIDSENRIYTAGYDRQVTRRDTVGIVYGYSQIRFQGIDLGIDDHFMQLSYGRRVTGRVAFEVAAGPMIDVYRHSTTSSDQRYSWNAHSSLRYRLPRANLGFSYSHLTTNGSGVMFGAETDRFEGSVGVRLTRNWSGSINPGYARNSRLRQTTVGNTSVSFDSLQGGVSLSRSLGRYMDVSFRYSVQDQSVSVGGTPASAGGSTFVRHLFGFGFNWHTRPLDID